ncbi:hypothetical protein R6Q59_024423 [Mikania micrantha]
MKRVFPNLMDIGHGDPLLGMAEDVDVAHAYTLEAGVLPRWALQEKDLPPSLPFTFDARVATAVPGCSHWPTAASIPTAATPIPTGVALPAAANTVHPALGCYQRATRKRFFNQKEFGSDVGYLSRIFRNSIIDDGIIKDLTFSNSVCNSLEGYDDKDAVVIDQEGNPKGTRVFGAIARELRQFNFTKIVSLAPEVAGGDGTVGWVLGCLGELHERGQEPVPFGTGNDLSRSFGWGGSFSINWKAAIKRILDRAIHAPIGRLDRYVLFDLAYCIGSGSRQLFFQDSLVLITCFSVYNLILKRLCTGMDAQVAYGFHQLRNEKPYLAQGRIANKAQLASLYQGKSLREQLSQFLASQKKPSNTNDEYDLDEGD